MPRPTPTEIRELMLTIARELQPRNPTDGSLQQGSLFRVLADRLNLRTDPDVERDILTQWHDLIRTGYFAWGFNLNNPDPPFFHFTDRGRRALEKLTRDPGNPEGYRRHLANVASLNAIAQSYLDEGLECYVSGHYKAAAVLVGAAAESVVLELRDAIANRMAQMGMAEPKSMSDWRVKVVLDTVHSVLESKKSFFPKELREEFEAYWLAFAQLIRTTRNDAGHPSSVDPVTEEGVHASFLVLPELARLSTGLSKWVTANLK